MSVILDCRKSSTSESLGVECFQPSLAIWSKLCFSSSCISSPGFWQNTLWVNSDFLFWWHFVGWRLLGFPCLWAYWKTFLISDPPWRPHHGSFSRLGAEGSAVTAFNPLATQRCMFCSQVFSSLVCQAVVGQLKHIQQKFTNNVGRSGLVGVLERVYQTMPFDFVTFW